MTMTRLGYIKEKALIPLTNQDVEFQKALRVREPQGSNEAVNKAYAERLSAQSRGSNLVLNGYGSLGDETNFKGMVFAPGQGPQGNHAFAITSSSTALITTGELIYIDPSSTYEFSFWLRHEGHEVEVAPKHFALIMPFDVDEQSISAPNHMFFAKTKLSKQLKLEDTEIHLVNSKNWINKGASYQRGIRFGYSNSYGLKYQTYSRFYRHNVWPDGGLNYDAHVIRLKEPWDYKNPLREDGIWPSGWDVSNTNSGSAWKYIAMTNTPSTKEWKKYSAKIGGVDLSGTNKQNMFPEGTAMIKVGFFLNYAGTQPSTMLLSNVVFYKHNM